jgi:ribulose-bisphosphate carboxylase large chain
MLPDVAVRLTGSRFRAGYRVSCGAAEAAALAEALAVEQTLEFPAELLADGDIRRRVKGQVEKVDPVGENLFAVEISYADEVSGFELPQLLNVLFGNVSLLPGIRLERIDLTEALLAHFRGPRFGRAGLRRLVRAEERPLLATALKPMGLPPAELARLAGQFALGGIDLIKDDHGLANQPFAPWRERVAACAEAVRDANAHSDGTSLYLPSASGPMEDLFERVLWAKRQGAGGLLVIPGLVGWDTMRALADSDEMGLPIMSHPAFLGGFTDDRRGVAPAVLFGALMRLAGADAVIYPNYGGRFSFSREQCLDIADGTAAPMGRLASIFPVPSGGMTLERVPEMLGTYGHDVILLIGGGLFSAGPSLTDTCRRFRGLVDESFA